MSHFIRFRKIFFKENLKKKMVDKNSGNLCIRFCAFLLWYSEVVLIFGAFIFEMNTLKSSVLV